MSNQNIPDSSQEFGELIAELKKDVTTCLRDLISRMLTDADEKLLDMADSAAFSHEKDVFYWLKNKVKEKKGEVAADFISNILPLMRPYAVTQAEEAAQKTQELGDELSLVGTDDMEDLVLVKNVGTESASKFREQISHLETRLDHLALKTSDIFARNALSPMKICQAFDDTLMDKFDLPERKILFRLFSDDVAHNLDSLYDELNKKLIEAGILPQIRAHTRSGARRAPAPQQAPADMPAEEHGTEGMDQVHAGDTYGGAPASGAPASGQAAHQDAGSPPVGYHGGATATPGGNYGGAPAAPGSAPSGEGSSGTQPQQNDPGSYQHQTAGMPAGKVSNTIGSFLGAPLQGGGANAAHSGTETPSYPASTPQHFGHDEIITALSNIQAQPQFTESGELKFDAEAVKQAVLSALAKASGGVVTKRMNQIAEKTIDFIELVFDAIIEDEDISDTIKALLLRLQIPVIKASMIDQEFFIYDDHPARVLLDRIAEVGMGVTQHTDEVYIRLDKIVSQLISEYELDTATFQKALDKVNNFVEEREEAARIKEEEAQKQALREHARNAVLKSLRNVTTGKTLPEAVHALVLKRWPTLMFNHYLEHGKENDEWVAILELLRDIIDSVQPLKSAEDLAYLVAEKDRLIERVTRQLSKTYKSKKDIQLVVGGLVETYDDMISDANFQEEEIEVAEKTIAEKPREKQPIKPEPAHVPKAKLPSNIMPGMWFQISTGEGKPARRCKLSVIIVEDEKLVFVTHDGELIAEKSFEEFTNEINKGISKVIMGHSVFDYALNSVITKLEPTIH
jgi:hypothetical protein